MNVLPLLIIAVSFFVIVLTSYGLAKFLNMKRSHFPWVAVSWGMAVAAAYAMYEIGLNYFSVDGVAVFAVGFGTLFLMFVSLLRSGFMGAVTLMIASVAVGILLLGVGYFTLGQDEKAEVISLATSLMPESEVIGLDFETRAVETVSDNEEEIFFSESDLLPIGAVKAKKTVVVSRSYKEVEKEQIGRFKGYKVRITRRDNKILRGTIIGKGSNKLVISHYLAEGNGLIEAPVKFSSIKKMEVYR
ncbi:MAG: Unknown protein [uncultured Thiotrichaceae bacterium]|uniref:Uncharacterized protein n=1 Tax=uncultured Thiotrichaceae bacterium TaxID=298394 RepID=A0A6S6UE58_9GAMM|nr:MAG: Unknown protein [uncultured Thiotrichaceae bacterium]